MLESGLAFRGNRTPFSSLCQAAFRTQKPGLTFPENALVEGCKSLSGEVAQLLAPVLADLRRPLRVRQDGPADRHQIEVASPEPAQKLIQRTGVRTLALERSDELAGQAH